jgi:hypothetical protein
MPVAREEQLPVLYGAIRFKPAKKPIETFRVEVKGDRFAVK